MYYGTRAYVKSPLVLQKKIFSASVSQISRICKIMNYRIDRAIVSAIADDSELSPNITLVAKYILSLLLLSKIMMAHYSCITFRIEKILVARYVIVILCHLSSRQYSIVQKNKATTYPLIYICREGTYLVEISW